MSDVYKNVRMNPIWNTLDIVCPGWQNRNGVPIDMCAAIAIRSLKDDSEDYLRTIERLYQRIDELEGKV